MFEAVAAFIAESGLVAMGWCSACLTVQDEPCWSYDAAVPAQDWPRAVAASMERMADVHAT